MLTWFEQQHYCLQALFATIFTWGVTMLGASLVFLFKRVNRNVMDAMLGFAAGVMIAASFWSLLSPAILMAESLNMTPWIICFLGFFSGGVLLFISDKMFYYFNRKHPDTGSCKEDKKRCFMLILSITIHNIPEGMAVGVAFGSLAYCLEGATFPAACLLALGIGIQNFPEGTAVSVPLRRDGYSRKKAFFYGQLSGIVEPVAGVLGAFLVLKLQYLLPFLLAFAAGAMIYVVIEELVPESQSNTHKELMALATLIGFSVMMILDISLGG